MKSLHSVTFILLIIGGLNWLLVGVIGWDIGQLFGGQGMIIPRIIYVLVGLAAVYEIISHKKRCMECKANMPAASMPSNPPMPGQRM